MKKSFLLSAAVLLTLSAAAQVLRPSEAVREREARADIPDLLAGVWQGNDRLVLFGKDGNEFAAVLRVFSGRYADRAAEPAAYAEYATRDRNDATSRTAEHIEIAYITIAENASHTAGAYELQILYPGSREYAYVPIAVIGGDIYLDFLVKGSARDGDYAVLPPVTADGSPDLEGFWRDCGAAAGLLVSPPSSKKERTGYYFSGGTFYHIRYWETDMPYTYEQAGFTDGDQSFVVDKYVRSAGKVYTNCTGRRTQIRNIKKSSELPGTAHFDRDGVICAFGSPYLVRLDGRENRADLQQLTDETNAAPRPSRKPVFPVTFPDVRWPDYDALDIYDPATWNRRMLDVGK